MDNKTMLLGGALIALALGTGVVYARRDRKYEGDYELVRVSIDKYSDLLNKSIVAKLHQFAKHLYDGEIDFSLIGNTVTYGIDGSLDGPGISWVIPSSLIVGFSDLSKKEGEGSETLKYMLALMKDVKAKVIIQLGAGYTEEIKKRLMDAVKKSGVSYDVIELTAPVKSTPVKENPVKSTPVKLGPPKPFTPAPFGVYNSPELYPWELGDFGFEPPASQTYDSPIGPEPFVSPGISSGPYPWDFVQQEQTSGEGEGAGFNLPVEEPLPFSPYSEPLPWEFGPFAVDDFDLQQTSPEPSLYTGYPVEPIY